MGAFAAVGLAGSGIVASVESTGRETPAPPIATEARTAHWDTFADAIADRASPALTSTYLTSGNDSTGTGTVDTGPLVDDRKAGYVALITSQDDRDVRSARADLCDIEWHPMDPAGRDCEVRDHGQGSDAVLTYADSNQGRTVLVRVASKDAVVTVAQSMGWPHYPPSESSDPTLLPWDLRDALEPESPEPGDNPERAQLDSLPLDLADQVDIAQAFALHPPPITRTPDIDIEPGIDS